MVGDLLELEVELGILGSWSDLKIRSGGYLEKELDRLGVKVAGEHVLHHIILDVPECLDDPDETLVVVVEKWVVRLEHEEVYVVELMFEMLLLDFVIIFDLLRVLLDLGFVVLDLVNELVILILNDVLLFLGFIFLHLGEVSDLGI